ncbi:MAG: Rieske 2Fe-2S domain-containing protein [Gemmatimonadaceae bacterium]
MSADWQDVGPAEQFAKAAITPVLVGRIKLAITHKDGEFGAISGVCNHAGGPLGEGTLDGDYVKCPWHNWKYHRCTGLGEPGFEDDAAPAYPVRAEAGRLLVDMASGTKRTRGHHEPHPLARRIERAPGPIRVVGISSTNMDLANPRYSTSDALLDIALEHAATTLDAETRKVRLAALKFRQCEGYYSKSAHACTWPCSITQMDPADEMAEVYEAVVHWADVILVATPIRWGNASALLQDGRANELRAEPGHDRQPRTIRNKVASFIITGGQDNVQAVVGQMLRFSARSDASSRSSVHRALRGWSAEDMEHNIDYVMKSEDLRQGARALSPAPWTSHLLLEHESAPHVVDRGGRKAHALALEASE